MYGLYNLHIHVPRSLTCLCKVQVVQFEQLLNDQSLDFPKGMIVTAIVDVLKSLGELLIAWLPARGDMEFMLNHNHLHSQVIDTLKQNMSRSLQPSGCGKVTDVISSAGLWHQEHQLHCTVLIM